MRPRAVARAGVCLALTLLAPACVGDEEEARTEAETSSDEAVQSSLPSRQSLTDTELGQVERGDLQLALAWTRGPTRRSPPETGEKAALREWQVRARPSFDRFLLTFGEDDPVPGYRVEFVEPPIRACGSDGELDLKGRAFLRVRVSGVAPESPFERDTSIRPRGNVRDLRLVCETGDAVEFVLPLSTRRDYRILEARNPRRLVVDVQSGTQGR